jgi:hypothetical protein
MQSNSALRTLRDQGIGLTVSTVEACLEAIGVHRPRALLLLGHMRSGSTLLLHLLMTNPEVSAVGERGAVYASKADFARLALVTRLLRGLPLRRLRYVVDQINHSQLTPDTSLLQSSRVRVLFILRRPEASIASILELYRTYYPEPWTPARAVDYYAERLETLAKLGESLPSPTVAALIPYELLTESPVEMLEALRVFLGLSRGFSQTYDTYSFTGKYGDPGPKIALGRIDRPERATDIQLSAIDIKRATEAYLKCHATLARFALPSLKSAPA